MSSGNARAGATWAVPLGTGWAMGGSVSSVGEGFISAGGVGGGWAGATGCAGGKTGAGWATVFGAERSIRSRVSSFAFSFSFLRRSSSVSGLAGTGGGATLWVVLSTEGNGAGKEFFAWGCGTGKSQAFSWAVSALITTSMTRTTMRMPATQ